jgi:hypothetical protein
MLNAFIIAAAIGLFVQSIYMAVRNHWVFNQRRKISNYCFNRDTMEWWMLGRPETDDFLPTYSTMMRRFWVWDVKKFYKRPLDLDKRGKVLMKCLGDFGADNHIQFDELEDK